MARPKKTTKDKQSPMRDGQMTNEEQMMVRQSAPHPTIEEYANNLALQDELLATEQSLSAPDGSKNGFDVVNARVNTETIRKATETLKKYKSNKANLEKKVIENEQWYKLRHWECLNKQSDEQIKPRSAWLFNCIENKHADAMDNIPEPTILPREANDRPEAKKLTEIIPVVLEQNNFEQVYSDVQRYKLKTGTGVYECTWDFDKLNGLGDISIKKLDLLNVFWQSGVTDIQDSRNLFITEVVDNEALIDEYPQLQGKLGSKTFTVSEYIYDDAVDTTNSSVVIDWFYKKMVNGKKVLHYCKFVNEEILFASENEIEPKYDDNGNVVRPPIAETGWYQHGLYPVVFDPLFQIEGTPCGIGYIDVGKPTQELIDRGDQALMMNMMANSRPRHFIKKDGAVSEEEYADMTKDFIHVDGQLGQDSILPVEGKPLNGIYVSLINNKVEELKEVTGNRDVSNGGTTSGVTSASGIASLQEASSKLSRDSNKQSYRAYSQLVMMCIELIRQFYDVEREFRIVGENGMEQFTAFSNAGIVPQPQAPIDPITGVPTLAGVDVGYRVPIFDIQVSAQKQSPYSKVAQNELALQFYNAGFFEPERSNQALACLEMMDFARKETIMQRIAQNGTFFQQIQQMQQQMLALAQMVDAQNGSNEITNGLLAQFGMQPMSTPNEGVNVKKTAQNENLGGENSEEAKIAQDARKRVAESTSPDR